MDCADEPGAAVALVSHYDSVPMGPGAGDAAAGVAPPPEPSPAREPVVGYHYGGTNKVLNVEECPVLAPQLEQGIATIRAAITGMHPRDWPYQIEGSCGVDGATIFRPAVR